MLKEIDDDKSMEIGRYAYIPLKYYKNTGEEELIVGYDYLGNSVLRRKAGKGLTQRGTRLLLNKEYDKLNYGNSKKTKYIRAWNRVEALYTSFTSGPLPFRISGERLTSPASIVPLRWTMR